MPWIDLGTVVPPLNQWGFFPNEAINSETYRITLIPAQPGIRYKSYALIQFAWPEGDIINFTRPIKYWPTEDRQVFDQLIPTRIKELNGGLVWTPLIQKRVWNRFRGVQTNDGNWQVKLEYYL